VRWLLDTDTCSDAVMGEPSVFSRLDSVDRDAWAISSLVYAELSYGLERGRLSKRSATALTKFLRAAPVVPFDQAAAKEAAAVRYELEQLGKPSGAIDQLLAGHARALGAVFVTGNTTHFENVPGLRLENWRRQAR
jgi:tRNA(fMet)-specific endonuclease VapC